jgi:hypothetical protein
LKGRFFTSSVPDTHAGGRSHSPAKPGAVRYSPAALVRLTRKRSRRRW